MMAAKRKPKAKAKAPKVPEPRERIHYPTFPYDYEVTLCHRPIDLTISTDDADVVTCRTCQRKLLALV